MHALGDISTTDKRAHTHLARSVQYNKGIKQRAELALHERQSYSARVVVGPLGRAAAAAAAPISLDLHFIKYFVR